MVAPIVELREIAPGLVMTELIGAVTDKLDASFIIGAAVGFIEMLTDEVSLRITCFVGTLEAVRLLSTAIFIGVVIDAVSLTAIPVFTIELAGAHFLAASARAASYSAVHASTNESSKPKNISL